MSGSVRENILMGVAVEPADLDGVIRLAVMEGALGDLPYCLDAVIGRDTPADLAQRIAIARVFVRDPQLAILDDVSRWVDVPTERVVWDRVYERRGTTCLVASNRRSALRRADQIVFLREGRVEGVGTLVDLLEANPEMRRLWRRNL